VYGEDSNRPPFPLGWLEAARMVEQLGSVLLLSLVENSVTNLSSRKR
jgi:hypothetical protein